MSDQRPVVPAFTCQSWRKLVQARWKISEVARETRWCYTTVQSHVLGQCRHSDKNKTDTLHFESTDLERLRRIYKRTGSPLETSLAMGCHPNTVLYHTKDLRKYGRGKGDSSRDFYRRRASHKEE